MNTLYPIFLKLDRTPVLVVGGGKVAEQKVKGLLNVNASVTVIAPRVTEWIDALALEGKITLHKREYSKNDVEGSFLVFAATDNSDVHQKIFYDASLRNIPVNVVDVPDLCNFYLASIFQNGNLKIAVSTNGKSPTLGKIIRDRIAAEFGKGYPELLDTLGQIRYSVHSIYPDPDKRKEVLEKIVDDELNKAKLKSVIASEAKQSSDFKGKVILVGAGPGDPELISVKGLRAIQHADVIAYDALVSPQLLSSAKTKCEKIFVGKRSGEHYAPQQEINTILALKAKEGKMVVRLKGGDPFVFGRGGEETEALRAEGVDVEIIPGITAGTGIPSSLGIPLTHRGAASSVVFVTGNECSEKEKKTDWKNIAAIDTIVIYMGVKNLPRITEKLFEAGRSRETPAAVIFSGTTSEEIVLEGLLGTIVADAGQLHVDGPGIIIIGDVVRFLKLYSSNEKLYSRESALK